jgi:hypothetical protein
MEPHGQSPWYLIEIPSYACLRVAASAKAGQGSRLPKNLFGEQVGGLSTRGEIHRSIIPLAPERPIGALCIHPRAVPMVVCVGG